MPLKPRLVERMHQAKRVSLWTSLAIDVALVAALTLLSRHGPRQLLAASPHQEQSATKRGDGRGRDADSPAQIPARGWKDIAVRTWKEVGADNVSFAAAGITFFVLMALFPALVSFVSIYGLVAQPSDVAKDFHAIALFLPGPMRSLVADNMVRIAGEHAASLSFTLIASLLVSLWSANGAAKATITGLNIAYEEKEKRSFLHLNLVTLGFTAGLLALAVAAATFLVAIPTADARGSVPMFWSLVRWPLQWLALMLALAFLYRFGPSRQHPKWRWVSWGGAVAAFLWLGGSGLISLYFDRFAHLDQTYGPLAAAIGFMIWCHWSFYIVLAGAELNAEIEHQTARDSTTGAPAPLGARGAKMADTIGAAQH